MVNSCQSELDTVLNLPESGFATLLILFVSRYSVWIYQKVDLLHCGYCLYLDIVWIYKRVDLLYFEYYPYLGADSIFLQTL